MKNKYIIAFFIIGSLITIIGGLFKIIHLEIGVITGNYLLTVGMLTQVIFGVIFILKLVFSKDDNGFLNK